MIRYRTLKKHPDMFYKCSGLRLTGFYDLLTTFQRAYEDDLDERDAQKKHGRIRARGGGRSGALKPIEDKLLFILFYYRFYPTQHVQAEFFGMGQPQAAEWIQRLSPILTEALGHEARLPVYKTQSVGQVYSNCPGLEQIIRSTDADDT